MPPVPGLGGGNISNADKSFISGAHQSYMGVPFGASAGNFNDTQMVKNMAASVNLDVCEHSMTSDVRLVSDIILK